jgi:uncharacterized protein (TIGR03435 family)
MLQTLLMQRFGLVIRRQTKQSDAYSLIIDRDGSKLKRTEKEPEGGFSHGSVVSGNIEGVFSLKDLAEGLALVFGRPVINMTNLEGFYNVRLRWNVGGGPGTVANMEEGLSTALIDQLGLQLAPKKAPIDMLFITHINRIPTEN